MVKDLEDEKKIKIYELVLERYGKVIAENEEQSVSEVRQKVSPHNDFIKSTRDELIKDYLPYRYEEHFFSAVQKLVEYFQQIKTCSFPFTFWMKFEDIHELKVGNRMSKAIYFTAILRSLDSKDAKVIVTKSGIYYVAFKWKDKEYFIKPASGSMLANEDVKKIVDEDKPAYAFSDLFYENYEE